jgi:signal transduction histidine kinase
MGINSSILLLALIEDILDLSKIEAGTFSLNVSSFMIPDLLDDIREIFEFQ